MRRRWDKTEKWSVPSLTAVAMSVFTLKAAFIGGSHHTHTRVLSCIRLRPLNQSFLCSRDTLISARCEWVKIFLVHFFSSAADAVAASSPSCPPTPTPTPTSGFHGFTQSAYLTPALRQVPPPGLRFAICLESQSARRIRITGLRARAGL